jgi:hypothetical protein
MGGQVADTVSIVDFGGTEGAAEGGGSAAAPAAGGKAAAGVKLLAGLSTKAKAGVAAAVIVVAVALGVGLGLGLKKPDSGTNLGAATALFVGGANAASDGAAAAGRRLLAGDDDKTFVYIFKGDGTKERLKARPRS